MIIINCHYFIIGNYLFFQSPVISNRITLLYIPVHGSVGQFPSITHSSFNGLPERCFMQSQNYSRIVWIYRGNAFERISFIVIRIERS